MRRLPGSNRRLSGAVLSVAIFLTLNRPINLIASVVRHGVTTCAEFALTFDLCPVKAGSGFDRALVDFLVAHKLPATFFMTASWADKHPAQARELIATPFFEIGSHGEHHTSLAHLDARGEREEVFGGVMQLATEFGEKTTLFRPPYGDLAPDTVALAESRGLTVVLWSVVSGDPDPKLAASAIEKDVEWRLRAGSIVIFHANGRGWHTPEVVDDIYRHIVLEKGLKPVTVTELLRGCSNDHAPNATR